MCFVFRLFAYLIVLELLCEEMQNLFFHNFCTIVMFALALCGSKRGCATLFAVDVLKNLNPLLLSNESNYEKQTLRRTFFFSYLHI